MKRFPTQDSNQTPVAPQTPATHSRLVSSNTHVSALDRLRCLEQYSSECTGSSDASSNTQVSALDRLMPRAILK